MPVPKKSGFAAYSYTHNARIDAEYWAIEKLDLETSTILLDARDDKAERALEQLRVALTNFYADPYRCGQVLSAESARVQVAQDLRRCAQKAIISNLDRHILRAVLDVFHPASGVGTRIRAAGCLDTAEWEGARYRFFLRPMAAFAASYEWVFRQTFENGQLFEGLPAATAHRLRKMNFDLTQEVQHMSVALADSAAIRPAAARRRAVLDQQPYVGVNAPSKLPWGERTRSFLRNTVPPSRANNGLQPDIHQQLPANAIGFSSLYASMLEMYVVALRNAGCPKERWLDQLVRNIAPLSAIAALSDGVADTALFSDKRVIPAVRADESDDGWIIEADGNPPLAKAIAAVRRAVALRSKDGVPTMRGRGRCPSNDVTANPTSDADTEFLIGLIEARTNGNCPDHLRKVVTSADLCALLASGIAIQLADNGFDLYDEVKSLQPIPHRPPAEALAELAATELGLT